MNMVVIENRWFIIEVVTAVTLKRQKRKSVYLPWGVASDMPHYPEIDDTYDYHQNWIKLVSLISIL
jgi:N-ethylmaleimide reductase